MAAIETPNEDLERSTICELAVDAPITQPISEIAMPMPETITSRPAALLASWARPWSTLSGRPFRSGWTLMSLTKVRITNDLLCRGCGEPGLTGQAMGGAGTTSRRGRLPGPAGESGGPG